MTSEEVASGFLRVANEGMSRPIRSLTEGRGIRTSDHVLATFGGAGGQHACDVADALGIARVTIHRLSSVLSAYGMALADLTHEIQRPRAAVLSELSAAQLELDFTALTEEASGELRSQGFSEELVDFEMYLNLRYKGTNSSLMIRKPSDSWDFSRVFIEHHHKEFGFTLEREILVEDIRVRALGKSVGLDLTSVSQARKAATVAPVDTGKSIKTTRLYTASAWYDACLYRLDDLAPGDQIVGPAIILDQTQTIIVQPTWSAVLLPRHFILEKDLTTDATESPSDVHAQCGPEEKAGYMNPIQLSVFGRGKTFLSCLESMLSGD